MTKSAKKSRVLVLILVVLAVILVGSLWQKSSSPTQAQQVSAIRMSAPADLPFRILSALTQNGTPPYGGGTYEVVLTSTEGESRTCSISEITVTYSDVEATYASFPKEANGRYECRIWVRTMEVKKQWDKVLDLYRPRPQPDPVDVMLRIPYTD